MHAINAFFHISEPCRQKEKYQTFNALGVFVFVIYRLVCKSQGKDQHVQGELEGPERFKCEWGAIIEG
jgi:hypothetical protein